MSFKPIPADDLRAYVAHARTYHPHVPADLSNYIASAYAEMRQDELGAGERAMVHIFLLNTFRSVYVWSSPGLHDCAYIIIYSSSFRIACTPSLVWPGTWFFLCPFSLPRPLAFIGDSRWCKRGPPSDEDVQGEFLCAGPMGPNFNFVFSGKPGGYAWRGKCEKRSYHYCIHGMRACRIWAASYLTCFVSPWRLYETGLMRYAPLRYHMSAQLLYLWARVTLRRYYFCQLHTNQCAVRKCINCFLKVLDACLNEYAGLDVWVLDGDSNITFVD